MQSPNPNDPNDPSPTVTPLLIALGILALLIGIVTGLMIAQ